MTKRRVAFGLVVGVAVMVATVDGRGMVAPQAAITVSTLIGTAPTTPLVDARAIEADPSGVLYIYEAGNAVVQRRTLAGTLEVVAGLPGHHGTVDGTGTAARLNVGQGMARAADGTLYLAETSSHTIRRVTTAGVVTTVAGAAGQSGSADGVGSAARFSSPSGLIVDGTGVIYVADAGNHTLRRIAVDGTVTTLAGLAGTAGTTNGTGSAARFNGPSDVALGTSGDLFVAERGSYRVRRVTPDGVVTSVAGLPGTRGATNGIGEAALFGTVSTIIHAGGNVFYVSERTAANGAGPCSVRSVTAAGVVSSYPGMTPSLGNCVSAGGFWGVDLTLRSGGGFWALTGHAVGLTTPLSTATGLTEVDGSGTQTVVWSATNQPGGIGGSSLVAPHGVTHDVGELRVFGQNAAFSGYRASAFTPDGTSVTSVESLAHAGAQRDGRRYSAVGCQVSAVAGLQRECGFADGLGIAARFGRVGGFVVDASGVTYIADTDNHAIRRMSAIGDVTTIAGAGGVAGSADGVGPAARFSRPVGIAVDGAGVVYVADTGNHTIRRIAVDGTVTTVAGLAGATGSADGSGTAARFFGPTGLVLAPGGTLIVSDRWNHTIREVSPMGVVTTLAGVAGEFGSADGGATTARFREPQGLAIDEAGTVLVADTRNHTVRVIERGVRALPTIATHPVSTAVTLSRSSASVSTEFSVAASGTPLVSYQWQTSNDGGTTWTNVASGTRASLQYTARRADHGRRFRVRVSNSEGTVTSNIAELTVYTLTGSPTTVYFRGRRASSASPIAPLTPAQTVQVSLVSPTTPVWTATADRPWVQITGGSGTGAGAFTVAIDNSAGAVPTGSSHSATITISAPNAGLSTTVNVSVSLGGSNNAPFGNFDVPTHGATGLQGAIVVSGWALDDVFVDRVEIWRDLVPGELTPPYAGPGPGNGKVFIANGLFGEGTRPDVATSYNFTPMANRSGWGYMLLTYGFPDRGNGTYTLHAFAFDGEGAYGSLGSKTISVNNTAANKPFGTIDYPEQNGTVSGTYTANGWVLTPNVGGVPTCTFSHIVMELDSNQTYIPVTYGTSRPDVTSAFPGLSTSSAPGAQVTFDTRAYANGLHTIGWLAYDTCGRGEGIGSRFIWVNNPTTEAPMSARAVAEPAALARAVERYALQEVAVAPMAHVTFELPVIAGASWRGMQLVNGETQPLPVGSTLDPVTSTFQWRPLAGFFGTFELRFVAERGGVAVAEYPVRVVVR